MKKMEINKKKKANDTKDSLYFDVFLKRRLAPEESTKLISRLRQEIIESHKKQPNLNAGTAMLFSNTTSYTDSSKKQTDTEQRVGNRSNASRMSHLPSNGVCLGNIMQRSNNDDDDDKKPRIKEERRLGGCSSIKQEPSIKQEVPVPSMYFNSVIGLINKPKTVLNNKDYLIRYCHTQPVDCDNVELETGYKKSRITSNKIHRL